MKSTVEKLSPTRVRINVEVPFAELEPDFSKAYKELAQQVIPPGDSRRQVDVLIHLVLGYMASPATTIDLGNTEEVRALARETFAPILLAPNVPVNAQ